MKYWQALQRMQNSRSCPFCTLTSPVIIEETNTMIVTPSRAPYNPNHIMIVSKRHIALLSELTQQESKELFALIGKWNGLLHKSNKNILIYLKDGSFGKTIEHFHVHLIPDTHLGSKELSDARDFLTLKSFIKTTDAIRNKFL